MTVYKCQGFRPLRKAETFGEEGPTTIKEAAEIFANRLAKREYGRKGYCRLCNANSWGTSFATYQVFIGYDTRPGGRETAGHNDWLTVSTE